MGPFNMHTPTSPENSARSSAVTWLLDRAFSTDPASRIKRPIQRLVLLAGSVLNTLSSNQVTALLGGSHVWNGSGVHVEGSHSEPLVTG